METGRRVDVPIVGIGMPGHFLVRDATSPEHYADPFDGRMLDRDGCRALFAAAQGQAEFSDELLAPVGPRAIVARLLANLKGIYSVAARSPQPRVGAQAAIRGSGRTARGTARAGVRAGGGRAVRRRRRGARTARGARRASGRRRVGRRFEPERHAIAGKVELMELLVLFLFGGGFAASSPSLATSAPSGGRRRQRSRSSSTTGACAGRSRTAATRR